MRGRSSCTRLFLSRKSERNIWAIVPAEEITLERGFPLIGEVGAVIAQRFAEGSFKLSLKRKPTPEPGRPERSNTQQLRMSAHSSQKALIQHRCQLARARLRRQKGILHQMPLSLQQGVQVFVEGRPPVSQNGKRNMNNDLAGLSYAMNTRRGLIFYRRIPPARQMNDMVGAGQRQANATCPRRQQHHIEPG